MKTPDPTKAESSALNSVKSTIPGTLPSRKNTVTADVLAKLLSYQTLTSIVSVVDSSTTRLGAFVWTLENRYGWTIERREKAQGCKDGRVSWVAEYWLHPDAIAAAMADGAGEWVRQVCTARLEHRKKAAQAKRDADRFNATKRKRDQVTRDLFETGA